MKRFEEGSLLGKKFKVECGDNTGPGPAKAPNDLNLLEDRDESTVAGA